MIPMKDNTTTLKPNEITFGQALRLLQEKDDKLSEQISQLQDKLAMLEELSEANDRHFLYLSRRIEKDGEDFLAYGWGWNER